MNEPLIIDNLPPKDGHVYVVVFPADKFSACMDQLWKWDGDDRLNLDWRDVLVWGSRLKRLADALVEVR